MARFPFAFRAPARWPLALLGVTPARAWVAVSDDEFEVRFGPWHLRTSRANVHDARRTGPYRWWRAIGPRLSLADRGATFGTTTGPGVCVRFGTPVAALAPAGRLRHPALTVTVADPDALVAVLTEGRR